MGDSRGHLPNRRQLFGPQRLTSAPFQSLENDANLVCDFVQDDLDLFDPGLRGERDRTHNLIQFARCVLDGEAQPHDRSAISPGNSKSSNESRQRPTNP